MLLSHPDKLVRLARQCWAAIVQHAQRPRWPEVLPQDAVWPRLHNYPY